MSTLAGVEPSNTTASARVSAASGPSRAPGEAGGKTEAETVAAEFISAFAAFASSEGLTVVSAKRVRLEVLRVLAARVRPRAGRR